MPRWLAMVIGILAGTAAGTMGAVLLMKAGQPPPEPYREPPGTFGTTGSVLRQGEALLDRCEPILKKALELPGNSTAEAALRECTVEREILGIAAYHGDRLPPGPVDERVLKRIVHHENRLGEWDRAVEEIQRSRKAREAHDGRDTGRPAVHPR